MDVLTRSRSVRGFLDRPVPRAVLDRILSAAARAPSGNNTQPWRVHVLTGAARQGLTDAILALRAGDEPEPAPEYPYAPTRWEEPYASLRRANGWTLYGLLGIAKGDRAAARAWHDENFRFFGAPVGLIFTLDRRLGLGAFIDLGMFMEAVVIAARLQGVESCAQAAFAPYHAVIRARLGLAPDAMVVCGMALGFPDETAVANRMEAGREAVDGFTTFHTGEPGRS